MWASMRQSPRIANHDPGSGCLGPRELARRVPRTDTIRNLGLSSDSLQRHMIRLQKLLAAAGLGSRRSVEQWIRDGRVTIAGRVAQLGDRASPDDEVCLDGRKLDLNPEQLASRELLLYHKPVGEVTTRSDPQGRPTVFERLPQPRNGRWITVGRLDVNTSGLLLFTTDGELAHRLMHPSSEIEREYLVRVRGRPQPGLIEKLLEGVQLDDGPARFDRVSQEIGDGEPSDGINTTFRVILHEGRNREVRRLWHAVGLEVSRLLRVRYGPIELPRELRPGASRLADAKVIEQLAAIASRQAAPPPPRAPWPGF
jgi:23S rRNA pseudouridine2605 synthase